MNAAHQAARDAIFTVADLHKRALARGDVARIPTLAPLEVLGLWSYISTIPGVDNAASHALFALAASLQSGDNTLLALIEMARQLGYLQCMDDLREERIAI